MRVHHKLRNTGAKRRCREAFRPNSCLNVVSDTRRGAPATGPTPAREIRLGQPQAQVNAEAGRAQPISSDEGSPRPVRLRRGGGRRRRACDEGWPLKRISRASILRFTSGTRPSGSLHGHDPAEHARSARTRRRLGDYENDYEKPEAQDSTKKCFMIAKKIRVNFEIDPLSGDKYGCMSCDPMVGRRQCPTQKRVSTDRRGREAARQDGLPSGTSTNSTSIARRRASCSSCRSKSRRRSPAGFFSYPEDTVTGLDCEVDGRSRSP